MTRAKLGLALAGGGFRASLFHVGVLHRMAEMDLLRYVQVLSTVSGGSIVGALYILLLKRELENPERKELGPEKFHIEQKVYEDIVDKLQKALLVGIRKNLRTRLFGNPLTLLKVMLGKRSLAEEMGRLYEKYIFATAIGEPQKLDPNVKIVDDSHRIPLTAIRIRKDQVKDSGGTENYNVEALDQDNDQYRDGKPGSAATRLILNTTSLNSGARFWFSTTEVGDWYLGHIRHDEIDSELLPRKIFRDLTPDVRQELIDAWPNEAERATRWDTAVESFAARYGKKWDPYRTEFLKAWGKCSEQKMKLELVRWLAQINSECTDLTAPMPCFKRRKAMKAGQQDNEAEMPPPWEGPLNASEFRALVRALLTADAGRLRDAKNYAWYLAKGRYREPRVDAGMDDPTLWVLFWDALKSIDEPLAQRLEDQFNKHQELPASSAPDWCKQLLDSVLEVYFCKTASVISPNIRGEWESLPLADTVAASAAFPPVFPPYQLYDLYDDMHVQILSLTDGGPFDNIGVTALLDEHCNYVIASDTGAPFDTRQSKAAVGRIGLMRRLSNLLMNRPAQLYRHDLNERRRLGRAVKADTVASKVPQAVSQFAAARQLKGLASFHIGSPRLTNDSPPSVEPDLIARLRTDLDIFGDAEIKCLINEGYVIADQYLRTGLKDSPFDPAKRVNGAPSWPPVKSGPLTSKFEKEHLENILKAGKHRLFRALRLIEPVSLLVVGVAAVALVSAVWTMGWEWSHVHAAINKLINWVVTKLLTWGWLSALSAWLQSIPLKWALPIVILALPVWCSIKKCLGPWVSRFVRYMRSEKASMWRKILCRWKNLKGFKGNLLWMLFKALPVVVLVVAPVAWVSHFFAWRFWRKTMDPEGLDK